MARSSSSHWMRCHAAAALRPRCAREAHARAAGDDVLATYDARHVRGMTLAFGPAPRRRGDRGRQQAMLDERDGHPRPSRRAATHRQAPRDARRDRGSARDTYRAGIEGTREAGQLVEAAAGCADASRSSRCAPARPTPPRSRSATASPSSTVSATQLPRNDSAPARRRARFPRRIRGGRAAGAPRCARR